VEARPNRARAHARARIIGKAAMAVAIVQKTRDFTLEVAEELKKVTWPDWPQLKSATTVILVFIVIVSVIIFTMDTVVRFIINNIINLFAR
jgi:preprotein translocase SecE subunit